MKTIAIVSDSAYSGKDLVAVGETIKKNILEVFDKQVTVSNYHIDQLSEGDIIDEDLVVVMAGSRAIKVKNFVSNHDKIIVARRTFSKHGIYQLFSIPEGTDVLVVNDNIETVLDSISSLYHIGVKHVNLIPFIPEKDYHHINHAVSPSEPKLVPNYIKHVYDVGSRVIDIPTMLLIISMLQINDKQTQQKLYNYNQKIFSPNEGIIQNYTNLLTRTEEMDQLLDLSHDGILLTDRNGKILIYNKKFKNIFEITNNPEGKYLHDIVKDPNLDKYYKNDFHNDLVTFKKKIINLEKRDVVHFDQEIRMYFSFQEVTHIKKLEQNLSQKLRQKGQIARYTFDDIICTSKDIKTIKKKAEKIASTDLTIMITGESGTGKEILAQAIHNASPRHKQPFIAINSAAIPENLIESELFGYASGSFTGALKSGRKGLFEQANNGTIFLDEIGDMPKHLQSKLLRVLQERQLTPIGSDRIIDIDVRVIAASHRNPREMIKDDSFRKDLFYRLNVFPLELPPLRRRPEDIPILLQNFTNNRFTFSGDCINHMMNYDWPGNIRELNNVAQYITTIEENEVVNIDSLPYYLSTQSGLGTWQSGNISYQTERMILEQKTALTTAVSTLKAIQLLNRIDKTAGRKHIMGILGQKNILVSESRLRKIIAALQLTELIITKKGRNGSYTTEKGNHFLSDFP
ncbi:MAG: sigma 54-interacting transcriptional regulator [Spirochaetia bacterium]|jgi:transcriptional regulator with PAS, ATPase and Fis domain|nr:sigma 54-interacting transcriptional regulator [Spirochaetia bacterium]